MLPLVSAIMVTGKQDNDHRRMLADNAIRSLWFQTHWNIELIIVNDGRPLEIVHERIKQICLPTKLTLGELRNIGLNHASGQWIVQWDDDDYSHPRRIEYQLQHAREDAAVLLRSQVRYSFANDAAYVRRWPDVPPVRGIPGTILHPNRPGLRYPAQARGEDDQFLIRNFRQVIVAENLDFPEAYVRFYHGQNTWDEEHIMGPYHLPSKRGTRDLPAPALNFLNEILEYYPPSS